MDSSYSLNVPDILIRQFPFLSKTEAEMVADALPDSPSGTHGERMLAIARSLEGFGLRANTSLLVTLAGAGSRSTAADVVTRVSMEAFEAARARRLAASPSQTASAPAAPVVSAQFSEKAAAQLEGLSRQIAAMAGDLQWLKSTVDTERQLRRHLETHGPLPEPGVPATSNRQIIGSLVESLSRSYQKPGAVPAQVAPPSVPREPVRGEGDLLDS